MVPIRLPGPLLLVVLGCAPGLPAPTITGVTPDWAYNGEETDIVVEGRGFYPRIEISGGDASSIDHEFRVWLTASAGELELEAVTMLDYTRLSARVPQGFAIGDYDLLLRSPTGEEDHATGLFTVTDTRADHLSASTAASTAQVGALVRIDLALRDPDEDVVPAALEIVVAVPEGAGAAPLLVAEPRTDQVALTDGVGVTGRLGAGGEGSITLTSSTPADLQIEVSAVDDRVVAPATLPLSFTSGDVSSVAVLLPEGKIPRAGEPLSIDLELRDGLGNVTSGVGAALLVYERCGDTDTRFEETIQMVDSATLANVVLTGATTRTDCDTSWIEVSGTASGVFIDGRSDPFDVEPGGVVGLELSASPTTVVAGEETIFLWVVAADDWDNPVTDAPDDPLEVTDSAGGLDAETGEQTCGEFEAGVALCEVRPWTAGEDISLTVRSGESLSGTISGITVVAGAPTTLQVVLDDTWLVAGETVGVELSAVDAWGNAVALDINGIDGADELQFEGSPQTPSCSFDSADAETARYSCALTFAGEQQTFQVSLPSHDLSVTSPEFDVINGALAQASVGIGGAKAITAGEALNVTVTTSDAWGNPYAVQVITEVELTDLSGDIAQSLTLDAGGVGAASVVPTTARDDNQLIAAAGGVELGSSVVFRVEPGATSALEVTTARPYAWLGEALPVQVVAVDRYGNTIPGYTGAATVTSNGGLGTAASITTFTDGVGETEFTYDTAGLEDTLFTLSGSFSGLSDAVDALDADCAAGPVAELLLDGKDELVHCLSGGATPSTSASMAGSTAGDASIIGIHVDLGPDGWTSTGTMSVSQTWTDVGAWTLRGVVVGADACGAEDSAALWVGEADGEPVGPVSVSATDTILQAADPIQGVTTVEISATDCAGDPSVGAVLLRADLGGLVSAGTTVIATGAGLTAPLDLDGDAQVTWSVAGQSYATDATLHVGALSGAAWGAQTLSVIGDAAPPVVLHTSPVGTTDETFDAVMVQFSEDMREQNATATTIRLIEPDGSEAGISGVTLDGDLVEMTLDETADASTGAWTLTVSDDVRDTFGNRLDGSYTGSSSDLTLEFGAVIDGAPDVIACTPSVERFRPDGDPGSGEEADALEIAASATGAPAWWELWVTDASGETVFLTRTLASGSTETISWDGRGLHGAVADNGDYDVLVAGLDEYWNAGSDCAVSVALDNSVVPPEASP